MAHEITELKVTVLRNPPWYRPRVWKLNVELVTPTFLLGGWSQDDDFIDTA